MYIHAFMFCAKAGALIYGYYLGSPLVSIIGFSMAGVVGYAGAITVILMHARKHSASAEYLYLK
ncbi:hypothetical protein D3C85_1741800 [compost metagenome]